MFCFNRRCQALLLYLYHQKWLTFPFTPNLHHHLVVLIPAILVEMCNLHFPADCTSSTSTLHMLLLLFQKYILEHCVVVYNFIPAFRRLRREDHKWEVSSGYTERPWFNIYIKIIYNFWIQTFCGYIYLLPNVVCHS
jgi:hypothetical protein